MLLLDDKAVTPTRWRTRWYIHKPDGTVYKTGTGLTNLKTALTATLMGQYSKLNIETLKEYY